MDFSEIGGVVTSFIAYWGGWTFLIVGTLWAIYLLIKDSRFDTTNKRIWRTIAIVGVAIILWLALTQWAINTDPNRQEPKTMEEILEEEQ